MSLTAKTFEVRDRMTFIPCVGIAMDVHGMAQNNTQDFYLARRAGYGDVFTILFGRMDGDSRMFPYDPENWNDRTMFVAHTYATEHWNELTSGDVLDVEFILGETSARKLSERFENG